MSGQDHVHEPVTHLTDEVIQAYLVKTRSGKPMVSVSYTSEVNDFSFLRQGLTAETGLQMFKEGFDWLSKHIK